MYKDEMWKIFSSTGKIDAYISYKKSENVEDFDALQSSNEDNRLQGDTKSMDLS